MGVCVLCKEGAVLRRSHYLPAAFYRRLRGKHALAPVVITATKALHYERQAKAELLCDECERRFKLGGEDWAIACSARENGFFSLRHYLLQTLPDTTVDVRGLAYLCSLLPRTEHQKLTYFAASVFWRGSVFDWNTVDEGVPQIDLTPDHQEQLRLYLLGKRSFPEELGLSLEVAVKPFLGMVFPERLTDKTRNLGMPGYFFSVYGLTFSLFLPTARLYPAINMAVRPYPIVLSNVRAEELRKRARELERTAIPRGKLRQHWNRS